MKNLIKTGIVIGLMAALVCVSLHIVKVESVYTYDNRSMMNVLTGRTLARVRRIETKLLSGEVVNDITRSAYVDFTGEMLAGDGQIDEVSYVLR